MIVRIAFLFASSIFSFWAPQVSADVYKFVDSTGHVFYTDRPRHAGFKRIIKTAKVNATRTTNWTERQFSPAFGGSMRMGLPRLDLRSTDFAQLIHATAHRYRLDPALLHAVIRAESAYNPWAVSDKGAVGLMQLMPGTAARYGVRDRRDPAENIDGGAHYLSDLVDMFPSDLSLVIAAYNAGENAVKRHGYKIPPIQETQDYVGRVLNYYRRMN